MITGQIIVRDPVAKMGDKTLVMIVGILGTTDPEFPLKGEHQYSLLGSEFASSVVRLNILKDSPTDLTHRIRGYNFGQTLTEPLWRV